MHIKKERAFSEEPLFPLRLDRQREEEISSLLNFLPSKKYGRNCGESTNNLSVSKLYSNKVWPTDLSVASILECSRQTVPPSPTPTKKTLAARSALAIDQMAYGA
jgi:hypothetical protein